MFGNNNPGNKPRRRVLGTYIIASVIYIILGVFMVLRPSKVETALCYTFGILMTIYGAVNIISFFVNKEEKSNLLLELIFGVLSAAFGVFTLFSPASVINILFIVIGAVIIIDGIINIKRSFWLKNFGERRWYVFLIISFISVLAGILTIIFRKNLGGALVIVLGINLIFEGIAGLVIMFRISRNKKRVERNIMTLNADYEDRD